MTLLDDIRAAGLRVELTADGRLHLSGPSDVRVRLRDRIKRQRDTLIAELRAEERSKRSLPDTPIFRRHRPDEAYRRAVAVLTSLGPELSNQAYAEVVASTRLADWVDRGLTLSTGRPCPLRLVNLRCARCYDLDARDGPTCLTGDRQPSLYYDHATLWLADGRPEVFVFQPYQLGVDEMDALVDLNRTYGLDVTIHCSGWHYPGWTLMVEIRRPQAQTRAPIPSVDLLGNEFIPNAPRRCTMERNAGHHQGARP